MNEACTNNLLIIDLSRQTHEVLPVPEPLRDEFIGGKGYGAKLLSDWLAPGTDPLAKDNIIMFLTGPLTGTAAPAMRGCVVTKSPLTGIFLDSYFGGSFAPEIKYAGYDGIIIKGKAEKPSYITIFDSKVEIRDARELWGADTLETCRRIKEQLGDSSVKTATIGPAGENQVLYSLICCEYNRQAGRGGAGAVMGSKNLKAIAVKGTGIVRVHDVPGFRQACKTALKELDQSPEIQGFRAFGTASSIEYANASGLLPHKNYKYGTFSKASKIGEKGQAKHLWLGPSACMGCPIHCSMTGAVRTGKYRGIVTDIIEYESASLMGANLNISDIRAIAHLVRLCDLYGLDTMSTGGAIGFVMEACEKGFVKSPKDIDICFGSVEAAEYLIRSIAAKSNELGIILSQGVKKAAELTGGNSSDFAVHIKGLESPAWGPRGVSGMGLAIMTADRGGCHQRGFTVGYELDGQWQGRQLDPVSPCNKAEMVVHLQNYSAGTDTLVKCDFGSFAISARTYADLLKAASGRQYPEDIFMKTGAKIWDLVRIFNLENGLDPAEDTLPRRFTEERLPDGPAEGHRISKKDMAYMKKEYYNFRGWDKKGVPMDKTLKRLRIEYAGSDQ